jgi:hypothetical protein
MPGPPTTPPPWGPACCELADGSPEAAKEYFAQRLRERFPKTDIDVGRLAVTVRFSDAEVQLLPAVSCKSNVQIGGRRVAARRPRTRASRGQS